MSEKLILFCGDMVRAILDGRKTQTRRVAMPDESPYEEFVIVNNQVICCGKSGLADSAFPEDDADKVFYPRYRIGDGLYILEPHRLTIKIILGKKWVVCVYKDKFEGDRGVRKFLWSVIPPKSHKKLGKIRTWGEWRSSRFMYEFLARKWVEVTKVRVERLQKITKEDAKAEGVEFADTALDGRLYRDYSCKELSFTSSPIDSYRGLWDSLDAERGFGWETNPYVFVYDFKVIKK